MTISLRVSLSNYFQRSSSESVLTRLWFRWISHSNKNGIEHLPDTYLAKIHTRPKPFAPDHEHRQNVSLLSYFFSGAILGRTAASRVFKQSASIYLTPRFCMQTFSEFLCQHKIEATSSLFLEHLYHQSETTMATIEKGSDFFTSALFVALLAECFFLIRRAPVRRLAEQ